MTDLPYLLPSPFTFSYIISCKIAIRLWLYISMFNSIDDIEWDNVPVPLSHDGLFHGFSWFATVGSLFMVADLRRRNAWWPKRWIGATLIGLGAFNLYDGTIQHKLLRIHQIRYDTNNLLMNDIVWNVIAVIILIIGITVVINTRTKMKERTS